MIAVPPKHPFVWALACCFNSAVPLSSPGSQCDAACLTVCTGAYESNVDHKGDTPFKKKSARIDTAGKRFKSTAPDSPAPGGVHAGFAMCS